MTEQSHFHDHRLPVPEISHPDAVIPSHLDEYLFDLNGYLILRGVLSPEEIAEGNALIDALPANMQRGDWDGWVQREDHPDHRGTSYQQIFELGGVFERMIDHPRYLNYFLRFIGGHGTHDKYHGPAAIDEAFFTVRGRGQAIPVHSGGHEMCSRTGYRYHDGRFLCGEINILTAFTDIGPGDGATMVIPGSHKSNMIHPAFLQIDQVEEWSDKGGGSADNIEAAIEVHMKAGDMLLFVDALCHGSARRVNEGDRRISVYRYGSAWNRTRFGHTPSPEMLARANPFARKLIHPRDPIRPPGTKARW